MTAAQTHPTFLTPHSSAANHGQVPPVDCLMKYVDQSADYHWFWRLSLPYRRLNHNGHAIWSWRPDAQHKRQIVVVARLLVEHTHGPFPPRTSFRNTCALSQCISPQHWSPVLQPPIYLLLSTPNGWQVVLQRTGKPIAKAVPVRVSLDGVAHLMYARPDPDRYIRTVCGADLTNGRAVIMATGSAVTCTKGC